MACPCKEVKRFNKTLGGKQPSKRDECKSFKIGLNKSGVILLRTLQVLFGGIIFVIMFPIMIIWIIFTYLTTGTTTLKVPKILNKYMVAS